MARIDSLGNFLTDVAESIRLKRGITTKISCVDYDKEIKAIETGKEPTLQIKEVSPKTIAQIITADEGYDGLAQVQISPVLSSIDFDITSNNIRKGVEILGVIGTLEEGVVPDGLLEITSNGTYDVTSYKGATVNVGNTTLTKGIIPNNIDSDGYVTDLSIVGLETIPRYYLGVNYNYFDGTNGATYLNNKLNTVTSQDAKTIDIGAFYNLLTAKNFYFPEVETLNKNVFYGSGIEYGYFPKLTTIGSSAFANCQGLTNLDWFPSLTTIGESAFSNCNNLTTANFPSTVSVIPNSAFNSCDKLDTVIFTPNIHTISDRAFYQCAGLKKITIPETVTSFGEYVFYQCSKLEEVTIYGDRATIPTNTFNRCTKLAKVCLPDVTSVPTIDTYVFKDSGITSGIGYIYVPDSLVDSFKTASIWKNYTAQIKPLSELTE